MYELVTIRHGESIWNQENRFTGWVDVGLSPKGIEEAHKAAKLLQEHHFQFDRAFVSVLQRAIKTLWIVLEEMDLMRLPVEKAWQLNERHYGGLQGLNKAETIKKHGPEKVHIWRRSFTTHPPPLDEENTQNLTNNFGLDPKNIPAGESLQDTLKRVIPFWQKEIAPCVQAGQKIIISAHGNSLRALAKHLEDISDEDISDLNIPTGTPLVYELDKGLKPIKKYYLDR